MAEIQSEMHIDRPDELELEYTRLMMGFLLFHPRPRTICMVGLGGGSLAKFCYRHVTSARMCVVEINPEVIALRDEFHIPPDGDRFRVLEGDGAHFVRFPPKRFDVLLVDGFDYDGQPRQLCSARFYNDCFDFLMPGGMLVVNLHAAHADHSRHLQRIRDSFNGSTLVVDDEDGTNVIVFANKGCAMASLPLGPLPRPTQLDERSWELLQRPFSRVLYGLKVGSS